MHDLLTLAQQIAEQLKSRRFMLATAESCTGGELSQTITAIPGSSEWFERGFIVYSSQAKQDLLSVPKLTLDTYGTVSKETVQAMAAGALMHSRAQVSIAITGIAGPSGGTPEKPVGTVWIAWGCIGCPTQATLYHFSGDRLAIRSQAVREALSGVVKLI
jgi:nicotinamide-nucleotide amidase